MRPTANYPATERGQALVEFALILLILMAMLVGMVHIANLLNYQYWAQQEARFLAFEQTWVPQSYYDATGETPQSLLEDTAYLHRPRGIARLDAVKEQETRGGLTDLLAWAWTSGSEADGGESVLVASNADRPDPIWSRKTSEWLLALRERASVVTSAYASLVGAKEESTDVFVSIPDRTVVLDDPFPRDSLPRGLRGLLENVEFGESFCASMRDVFAKHDFTPGIQAFSGDTCASYYRDEFALHIAKTVDLKSLFQDYAYELDQGFSQRKALERVLTTEITNQFFSFFDQTVAIARVGAVPFIANVRIDKTSNSGIDDIVRILTEARYVGSSVAVLAVTSGAVTGILNVLPASRDVAAEKQAQDIVFDILHADLPDASYFLNPTYLPVPPTFGGGMSALQNAVMENVLRGGENEIGDFFDGAEGDESDLIAPLIQESNREGRVTYNSGRGIFPAAARKFRRNNTLTSRFFLITQPWHITRKESALGEYRDIGNERDGIGEETEEAVLRRRVAGLWLFPSAPTALFRAPLEFIGDDGLSEVLEVVSGFDSFIATIKTILIDNPILTLFDTLSEIPLIGGLVPTIPKFPVVRPAAYPSSVELRDQEHSPDDQLQGEERNFSDYIEEQEFNPRPRPGFDNDTFQ